MVSENIKDPSVTFLMPELPGNGTSFDFFCHLHQEMPLFLVCVARKKSACPHLLQKRCGGQPKKYF